MKKLYISIVFLILSMLLHAQTFDYSLAHVGYNGATDNHQIALIATPNADVVNGNTADMGAVFFLPNGLNIGNFATADSGIPAGEWTATNYGDVGGVDFIQLFRSPGPANVFFNVTSGTPIQLAIFDIIATPDPTSGSKTLVENTDFWTDVFFAKNYLNINLGAGTIDAYAANNPSAKSIDFSLLGVNDVAFNEISVYPNPTKGNLNIETIQPISFSIYNILGQSVKMNGLLDHNSTKSLSLSHLPDGIYILKAQDENNNSKSFKIIKKE